MARIEQADDGSLTVVLSERNLLTLLSKLYTPGSACSFTNNDTPEGIPSALIKSERDDVHYSSPTRLGTPAGAMHPVTEKIMRAIKDAVEEVEDMHVPTAIFLPLPYTEN